MTNTIKIHLPNDAAKAAEQEQVEQQSQLINELRKDPRFRGYQAARNEARRQRPELFS